MAKRTNKRYNISRTSKPESAFFMRIPGLEDSIKKSADTRTLLEIYYVDSKGVGKSRFVEPYEYQGEFIYAYCNSSQGIRKFRLNNIRNVKNTKTTFIPRWEIKI